MKRTLMFLMVFTLISSSFVNANALEKNPLLLDIRNTLNEYISENSINVKEGTQEYYEYLLNQLMYHEDKKLSKRSDYEEILDYASLYLVEYQTHLTLDEEGNTVIDEQDTQTYSLGSNDKSIISSDFFDMTVEEASDKLKEEEQAAKLDTASTPMALAVSGYNTNAAIEYAGSWANRYNTSTYKTFSSDCTNFVSQCLVAGDISQRAPSGTPSNTILATTSYWYHRKISSTFYCSTSFVRVTDFWSYWQPKSGSVYYSTRNSCASAMKKGDVVLLARRTTGAKYHAIIISSGGSSGTYCGHTTARRNYPFKNISDADNNFYRLTFAR